MSITTIVVALLILVVAAAVWAISPPNIGMLVGTAIALVAVLYVGVSLA